MMKQIAKDFILMEQLTKQWHGETNMPTYIVFEGSIYKGAEKEEQEKADDLTESDRDGFC